VLDQCRTDLRVPRKYAPRSSVVAWSADCLEPRGVGQQVVEPDGTPLGLDVLANELGMTRLQADPYDEQRAPDHGLGRAGHAGEQADEAALVLDACDDRQWLATEATTQLRRLAASSQNARTTGAFGATRIEVEDRFVSSRDDFFKAGQARASQVRKEQEWQRIPVLADRLRQKLSSRAPQSAQSGGRGAAPTNKALAVGQPLLANLPSAEFVVRLVIDLERVLAVAPGSPDDYLRISGGTTRKAVDKRVYLVRANGSIEVGSGNRCFRQNGDLLPGDSIGVPLDAERMRRLTMWTAVTSIIFNLAVAVGSL